MNGVVGHVKKKRLLRVVANELRGSLADQIGEVALGIDGLFTVAKLMRAVEVVVAVVVGVTEQYAKVFIKAAACRIVLRLVAEVPLAERAGGIAGGLHHFRDRRLTGRQAERQLV